MDLFFKYFMWGMNVNFLSNLTTRNLYSLTTRIYVSSSYIISLGIFLNWKKYTHPILLLEIVKPFVFVQWVIFRMHCCSWRWAIRIWKWSRSRQHWGNPQFQGARHFVMLFIFILNSVTDKIFPWRTPSSSLWRLEKADSIGLGISCQRENSLWSWSIYLAVPCYAGLSLFQTSRWCRKPSPDQRRLL